MNVWEVFKTTVRPAVQVDGTDSKRSGDRLALAQFVLSFEPGRIINADAETEEAADGLAGLPAGSWVEAPLDAIHGST